MFQSLTIFDFQNRFPDDKSCLDYLCELRWKEGFVCPKCGHTRYCKGDREHDRECTKCKHKVSPTSGTLFQPYQDTDAQSFLHPVLREHQQARNFQHRTQPQTRVASKDLRAVQTDGYAGHEKQRKGQTQR
jgi:hypothetical protein